MTLEDQISQMANPLEFTRLCNTVLTAEYGTDFQIVDGTRSDEGNDGYITSEKRLVAIYSPIKPEKKTDSDYVEKIKSDLRKADLLQKSGIFIIEKWNFITPRKLNTNTIAIMKKEAEQYNFVPIHQDATYLATLLLKHRHIVRGFPILYLPEIDEKLDEILLWVKNLKTQPETRRETEFDKQHVFKRKTNESDELEKVMLLRTRIEEKLAKSELRVIYYVTQDSVVKLNALLGLLDSYDVVEEKAEDIVALCDEGIALSKTSDAPSVLSYLYAFKGYVLSHIYSILDVQTAFQIMTDNAIGIMSVTAERRQAVIHKLQEHENEYSRLFKEAIDISKQSRDYETLASILIFIGNAAGQRAGYLNTLNVRERAASERQICKRSLLAAKDIYDKLGDELGATNTLFNLANQIRFFGEEKEALNIVIRTICVAQKYGDGLLLKKANWLKETLETGRIPDYMAGERRE